MCCGVASVLTMAEDDDEDDGDDDDGTKGGTPTCPESLAPKAKTRPQLVSSTVCHAPHVTDDNE